jgi:integrase
MTAHKLTAAQVAAAQATGDKPRYLGDGAGLWLIVHPSGSKNWIARYTHNGKSREMGLGGYPTIDLKEARTRNERQRRVRLDGKDPVTERRQARIEEERRGKLFAVVAEEFIAKRQDEWKHTRQATHWRAQLARYAYPTLGEVPVAAIDTGLVLKTLGPVWKTKTGVARALRGRIEQVLDYANFNGYCQVKKNEAYGNPARWRRHLEHALPDPAKFRPVKNFRSLPLAELGRLMLAVRRREGVAAHALDYLVLTGSRTTEVSEMTWSELDDHGVWTLPPRVKGRREGDGRHDHQIPLSDQALRIVEEMRQSPDYNGCYVFPGTRRGRGDRLGRSLNAWSMLALVKRLGYHETTVVHGLRSTVNSWALEQGVPTEPRRLMLSHVLDGIEETYRSTQMIELRRGYNQQWADFVDQEVARAMQIEKNRGISISANKDRRLLQVPILPTRR